MSLNYKVYAENQLRGACLYPEDAAMFLDSLTEDDRKIVYMGQTVWEEGKEEQPAGESFDYVAETIHERI